MITLDQGGRARGSARISAFEGPAAGLVEHCWVLGAVGDPPPGPGARWRVVPDVSPHLIVARYPDGRTRARLVGARSRWADVDEHARSWTVGVRFRPGTLPFLTRTPASDLRDRGAPLDEVAARRGRDLADRLEGVRGPDAAVAALGSFLDGIARSGTEVDWKVRGLVRLLARAGSGRVDAVSEDLGVPGRTLRAASRAHLGISPKRAQRIVRLQRMLGELLAHPGRPAGSAAYAVGFADHPHLIRESRSLLGETPSDFLARGRGRPT